MNFCHLFIVRLVMVCYRVYHINFNEVNEFASWVEHLKSRWWGPRNSQSVMFFLVVNRLMMAQFSTIHLDISLQITQHTATSMGNTMIHGNLMAFGVKAFQHPHGWLCEDMVFKLLLPWDFSWLRPWWCWIGWMFQDSSQNTIGLFCDEW